jgi:hypothetical protein
MTLKGTAEGTLLTAKGEPLFIHESTENAKIEPIRESATKSAHTEEGLVEAMPQSNSSYNTLGNQEEKLSAGRSLQIQQSISRAVTRHMRMGYIVVIAALLLNAIWMWYIPSVGSSLAYKPHVQPVVY